ncbi:MAG: response regulator [Cyclobacteriaceae bacterium]
MKRKRVLILDDEKEICFLLSALLRKMGYYTDYAYTIEEAMGKIKDSDDDFDIVFVDLNLPDGLGYYLVPDIKHHNPDSKVIMISAHDAMIRQIKEEKEEIDYFIDKPFNREKISEALQHVIEQKNHL